MEPIRLKMLRVNPVTLAVVIAQEQGYFSNNNVVVNLQLIENLYDNRNAFVNDEVDAMIGDLTTLLQYIDGGKQAKITSTLTRIMKIVLNRKFNNLTELTGLTIGVNANQSLGLYLEEFCQANKLALNVVDYPDAYLRFADAIAGKIDLLVSIEPFASSLVKAGGQVVYSGIESQHHYVMWAFSEKYYTANSDRVSRFHQSLVQAGEWFNLLTAEQKVASFVKYLKFDQESAEQFSDFFYERDISFSNDDLIRCYNWMNDKELLTHQLDVNELTVDVYK